MKTISSEALYALPQEVKELVRSGVYSLYTLKIGGPVYLLVTNRGEQYFLASDGSLASGPEIADLRSAIEQAVSFSDASTNRVMLNCA